VRLKVVLAGRFGYFYFLLNFKGVTVMIRRRQRASLILAGLLMLAFVWPATAQDSK
jgi:hypothetical protein